METGDGEDELARREEKREGSSTEREEKSDTKPDEGREAVDEGKKDEEGRKDAVVGDTTTVKKPPDVVCNCPQKCCDKLPEEVRRDLFAEFQKLGDVRKQNLYLQSYIEMRSVYKRLWCQEERVAGRLQRRVSCKYRLPTRVPKPLLPPRQNQERNSPPKLSTNSKGKMTFIIGLKDASEAIEVCQKAFMNVYGITEKRIRLQREKLIAKLRNDTIETMCRSGRGGGAGSARGGTTTLETLPSKDWDATAIHCDMAQVDRFFKNQLWKPEYIGMPPLTAKVMRHHHHSHP